MTSRTRLLLGIVLGLYLTGNGMLLGMLVERVHFDRQRTALLARYDQALRDWNAFRMMAEEGQ